MSARLPLADIRFLADFHAFALSKGDEAYNSCSSHSCALAQFGYRDVHHHDLKGVPVAAFGAAVCESTPMVDTFSALATRLETLLADAPAVELVQ